MTVEPPYWPAHAQKLIERVGIVGSESTRRDRDFLTGRPSGRCELVRNVKTVRRYRTMAGELVGKKQAVKRLQEETIRRMQSGWESGGPGTGETADIEIRTEETELLVRSDGYCRPLARVIRRALAAARRGRAAFDVAHDRSGPFAVTGKTRAKRERDRRDAERQAAILRASPEWRKANAKRIAKWLKP